MGIILGSASPRRASLLHEAGIPFSVQVPQVDELPPGTLPPALLCVANAELKARAVAHTCADQIVLGADTVVTLGGETFGKPADLEEAQAMLRKLAGRTHEVLTGVVLLLACEGKMCRFVESTRVRFRQAQAIDFDAYLARVNPLDKAGSYAAQEDEGALIEAIEGLVSNVVGLPVERVVSALDKHFPGAIPPQGTKSSAT